MSRFSESGYCPDCATFSECEEAQSCWQHDPQPGHPGCGEAADCTQSAREGAIVAPLLEAGE